MPNDVRVTVTVSGSTVTVQVDKPTIRFAVGERGPIKWTIDTEGWRFQPKGIDIADHGGEFDSPAGGGSPVFVWNNRHTRPGTYKYTVRVQKGGATGELDPAIIND
jgi:hypothetical protein